MTLAKHSLAVIGLLLAASAAAAQPSTSTVQREVATIFRTLEHSDCSFNRNGSWYDGKQAAAHLRRKYDYMQRKGLLTTSEAFIDSAASRSSMSGRAYLVRCGGRPATESRDWFLAQLRRLRQP